MITPAFLHRPLVARFAGALAAIILLVAMIALSRDFGATWDERALQAYGEQLWNYYAGKAPRSSIDTSFGYTRIYGVFVDFVSVAVQQIVPLNVYVVRHMVNATFGWAGVIFAFLMAARFFGARAGWLAAALMVCMPRYIAHSMNNPKDLPFAVLMLAGFYFILRLEPRYPFFTWRHGLALAVTIALAINVRSMGLVLAGYAALGLFIAVVASGERHPRALALTAAKFAGIVVLALLGGTAFWPWAQEQPLVRPVQAFFLASTFNWGNYSLFNGRDVLPDAIPWYYLPAWLAISTPLVILLGALLSAGRFRDRNWGSIRLAAIWAFILLPAIMAMAKRLSLYDGLRHMFFIIPPLAVLAAIGWDWVLRSTGGRVRAAAAFVLALGMAEPLIFQVRNHPNQAVYFSPVIGGPRGAFGRFEMDYWGNCVFQATDWAAQRAEEARMPVGVAGNAWEVLLMDLSRFDSLWFERLFHRHYHLDVRLLKGPRGSMLETAADPNILYRVTTADGTPLCVILPGPDYQQLHERLSARGSVTGE